MPAEQKPLSVSTYLTYRDVHFFPYSLQRIWSEHRFTHSSSAPQRIKKEFTTAGNIFHAQFYEGDGNDVARYL